MIAPLRAGRAKARAPANHRISRSIARFGRNACVCSEWSAGLWGPGALPIFAVRDACRRLLVYWSSERRGNTAYALCCRGLSTRCTALRFVFRTSARALWSGRHRGASSDTKQDASGELSPDAFADDGRSAWFFTALHYRRQGEVVLRRRPGVQLGHATGAASASWPSRSAARCNALAPMFQEVSSSFRRAVKRSRSADRPVQPTRNKDGNHLALPRSCVSPLPRGLLQTLGRPTATLDVSAQA